MDDTLDKRREWRAIRKREEARKKKLEELEGAIQEVEEEKKSPKSLLKLVVHSDGLRISEAADILGVNKKQVENWMLFLEGKDLVEVEGVNLPNPTIKPSSHVVNRLHSMRSRKKSAPKAETQDREDVRGRVKQLIRERREREKMTGELAEKERILREMEKELLTERKVRASLEERLSQVKTEKQKQADERYGELEQRYSREHAERQKLEQLLKSKQKELETYELELTKQKLLEEDEEIDCLWGEKTGDRLTEGGKTLELIKQKLGQAKKKLDSIPEPEKKQVQEIVKQEEEVSRMLEEELRSMRKVKPRRIQKEAQEKQIQEKTTEDGEPIGGGQPAKTQTEQEKTETQTIEKPQETQKQVKPADESTQTRQPAKTQTEQEKTETQTIEKPQETQKQVEESKPDSSQKTQAEGYESVECKEGAPVKSGIMKLIEQLTEKKTMSAKQVAGFCEDQEEAEKWVKLLVDKGLAKEKKHMLGEKEIKLVEGADAKQIGSQIEALLIRQELKRAREQ